MNKGILDWVSITIGRTRIKRQRTRAKFAHDHSSGRADRRLFLDSVHQPVVCRRRMPAKSDQAEALVFVSSCGRRLAAYAGTALNHSGSLFNLTMPYLNRSAEATHFQTLFPAAAPATL